MGTIDPRPLPRPVLVPVPQPPIPPRAVTPSVTSVGVLGMVFGFIVFGFGVLMGGDVIVCGLGLAFIALGFSARPKRLCPACKLSVPIGATVCGHCQRTIPS